MVRLSDLASHCLGGVFRYRSLVQSLCSVGGLEHFLFTTRQLLNFLILWRPQLQEKSAFLFVIEGDSNLKSNTRFLESQVVEPFTLLQVLFNLSFNLRDCLMKVLQKVGLNYLETSDRYFVIPQSNWLVARLKRVVLQNSKGFRKWFVIEVQFNGHNRSLLKLDVLDCNSEVCQAHVVQGEFALQAQKKFCFWLNQAASLLS